MDILIEAIKWIVIIGLIYYILDKTPIGVPIKTAMMKLILWCWHRVGNRSISPELSEQMNRLDREYGRKRKKKNEY